MRADSTSTGPPQGGSLFGWVIRDLLLLFGLSALVLAGGYGLSGWLAALAGSAIGFVAAYVACYAIHEWGHLLGARLTGAQMPLNRYASPLIGLFDPDRGTRLQFVALSWGGVFGYLLTACICITVWSQAALGWTGTGLAVGALAFVVQSLSVDLPQIYRVDTGGDPAEVNRRGTRPRLILRRTLQSWSVLATVLVLANVVPTVLR